MAFFGNIASRFRSVLTRAKGIFTEQEDLISHGSMPGLTDRQQRINNIYQSEIRQNVQEGSGLLLGDSAMSKEKAFYRATQYLWEGQPPELRNELIMQHFNVTSMDEAYRLVQEANPEAFETIESKYRDLTSTDLASFSDDELEQYYSWYREYMSKLKLERPTRKDRRYARRRAAQVGN